jgi:hypothetical protein
MDIPSRFPSFRTNLRTPLVNRRLPITVHPTNISSVFQILLGIPKLHILDLGRLSDANIGWLIQRA